MEPQHQAQLVISEGVTLVEVPRVFTMHRVMAQELDDFASVKTGVNFGFFGLAVGALIAFAIVLGTVDNLSAKAYATFFALTFLSGILTVFFGTMSIVEYRRSANRVKAIRERA
jgi:hypothetical protein